MPIMADFARLPSQRKVMVFIIAGCLLGLLYWQFVYKKLARELDDARGAHASKIAQSKKLDHDLEDYKKLQPLMSKLLERIGHDESALPTEAELPAFLDELNRKVLESGVTVNRAEQRPDEPVESFVRVPINFEIQGTFMQIKRFFSLLIPHRARTSDDPSHPESAEEPDRLVSIENLSVGDPQVRNHQLVMTARFTAMTFRKEEVKPPPSAKPAAAGATGAATGSRPPPAATPAGANAATNDAMDKDQQRSSGSAAQLKGGI
jgi:Pilus assembly protein, PilO